MTDQLGSELLKMRTTRTLAMLLLVAVALTLLGAAVEGLSRTVDELAQCTPHTLRRTYISLLLAAGCDPAYVQRQVGHTDPTLTLRIYQQLLKRKRREEYRSRVNDLLGTSPAALSKRPDLAEQEESGPNSGPNSLFLAV